MKWYYSIRGGHTHVRVFMNGASCGGLCFRNDEFEEVRRREYAAGFILFINETPETP
jgi:hypothetical protein